ncbi:basic proline-rich protein-like [Vulpes lagopus]|uniref:basic proline-rich protein-like n=1 Tax=Vulpes lagopus TaxID=494514 RepID=UPI001BC8F668|nr:basic proline-rich protein-like [Vulpes lagopus]
MPGEAGTALQCCRPEGGTLPGGALLSSGDASSRGNRRSQYRGAAVFGPGSPRRSGEGSPPRARQRARPPPPPRFVGAARSCERAGRGGASPALDSSARRSARPPRPPRGRASLARWAPAPRACSPAADRSPGRRGVPRSGRAPRPRPNPNPPARRGGLARRNFNLIPPPGSRPPLPSGPPPHKGARGGEAARSAGTGAGAQGAGLPAAAAGRQKGNCLRSPCGPEPPARPPAARLGESPPPPSAAAPPPSPRAGPAVLRDPASLGGPARRCWWLGL